MGQVIRAFRAKEAINEKFSHCDERNVRKIRKSISFIMCQTITSDTLRCCTPFHPLDTIQTDHVAETQFYDTNSNAQTVLILWIFPNV